MPHKNRWLAAGAAAGLLMVSAGVAAVAISRGDAPPEPKTQNAPDRKQAVGLMTSLPIYWSEANGVEEVLSGRSDSSGQHWVRTALEQDFVIVPLDTLHRSDGAETQIAVRLADLEYLLLAQPYTLTAGDNVALDSWVRAGGRLLMFSDPMLTEHSRFGIGDRRRPQDIGLVPAVFARWGVEQTFDEDQPVGMQLVDTGDAAVPVNLRGAFAATSSAVSGDNCVTGPDGLVATCEIGEGTALLVADAAVLEDESSPESVSAFAALISAGLK